MMDFETNKRIRDRAVKMREDQYKADSKKKLQGIIKTKLTTSFIGALSAFEKQFGFLWKDIDKTEEQRGLADLLQEEGFGPDFFEKLWNDARNEVLTTGNNQIRAVDMEFNQYTIHWDRYTGQLPVKPLDEEIGG